MMLLDIPAVIITLRIRLGLENDFQKKKKKKNSQLQFRSIGIKLSTETSGDLLLVVHTLGGVTGSSSNNYSIIY